MRPYLEKPFIKIRLVEWLKVKALSSSPSTAKKKKKKFPQAPPPKACPHNPQAPCLLFDALPFPSLHLISLPMPSFSSTSRVVPMG
jgi:hypothetical protein